MKLKIALASKSNLKLASVVEGINYIKDKIRTEMIGADIQCFDVNDDINQIEQPLYEGGKLMAKKRLETVMRSIDEKKMSFDIVVVIENYMRQDMDKKWIDEVYMEIYDVVKNKEYSMTKLCGRVPEGSEGLIERMMDESNIIRDGENIIGSKKTFGSLYHEVYTYVSANDWTGHVEMFSRGDVLTMGLISLFSEYLMSK